MPVQFEKWFRADLSKKAMTEWVGSSFFTNDNLSNIIGVELYDGMDPVDVPGTIQGIIILPNDGTITVNGSRTGNKAWIELPSTALALDGMITITIRATISDRKVTLVQCRGRVNVTDTGMAIDPDDILPHDKAELMTLIGDLRDVINEYTDIIMVQDTQPDTETNKLWLKKTTPDGVLVPTMEDLEEVSNEVSDLKSELQQVAARPSGGGGHPMIWCWGDSLTEGVGGYIMQADGHNAYMAYSYPAWLGQSWNVVNLGARSENIPAIMARQGADPIVLQAALSIPASKDTPVLVQQVTELYNQTTGIGFQSKSGALVKINKEVESTGLNPCRIAGVEGILYREIGNSYLNNEATYNYYFKRLEDGEAVTAPVNTEIETYAMRYCHGGVAIIWMGANGGYSSAMDFVNKVNAMVEYGQYDNYLVIISREFSGSNLVTIKTELTDPDGFCHVVDLMEQLPYRGYAMAGIAHNSVDTSGWETTDPIKKNAPLLCEYLSGQTGEAQYGALHYSAWGYKAIAKLIQEKLGTMGLTSSGGGNGGGTSPSTTNTDEYGTYLFKLPTARTFNGTNYLNTKIKLYDDLSKDWTFAIKWSGTPTCPDGYPANIFCCAKDGLWKGLLYRYYTAGGANILFGSSANNVNGENNMTDNYGGTNVVVIVKHGNEYLVFVNSAQKAFDSTLTYTLAESDAIDLPLIIGARWNMEGTEVQYKTAFTLEECRVYDAALDESEVIDLYNELAGQA